MRAAIAALGIFPKGNFHGHRIFDHHIVYPLAPQFNRQEGAAHHIGAARTCYRRGYAVAVSIEKGLVHGVQAVDALHMGGNRIGHLVIVVPLKAYGLLVQAHMAVAVHKARGHQATGGVDNLGVGGGVYGGAYRNNFGTVDEQLALGNIWAGHCFNGAVFN